MGKKDKTLALGEFDKIKAQLKDKKTVLVGGCFDLLHYGHLKFLKKAKDAGDFLIVAIESDKFIKNKKRKIPIHSQNQRAEILASLDFVDLVIILPYLENDSKYFEMVKTIKPSVIATTGGDPRIEKKRKQAEAIGADLRIVTDPVPGFSTKTIINKFL